jgi:predicted negative regulator of RcsB-dependent stress response
MADIKLNKKDVKSPDQIQAKLASGFQFGTEHATAIGVAFLAFVVIGAGIAGKNYLDEKKEAEVQTKYFSVEKKLLETKAKFETAANPPAADPKAKAPAKVEIKASGDFEKDYGPVAAELTTVIKDAPKSKAAKMAALSLSEVQMQYQKFSEAQATLAMVNPDGKDLLSAIVQSQLGSIQADQKDCKTALTTWEKVLNNKTAKALHASIKLKQGLCFEALNEIDKARNTYTGLAAEDKESQAAKTAEKYLRLLPGNANL